ncbi:hypothetical protein [Streptomyces anandii]|uniref:Uncharacterized protein n=1 Tax=Streptomyces anandii TaxID=285454 RepID=A0ABW6H4X5_9ACTN
MRLLGVYLNDHLAGAGATPVFPSVSTFRNPCGLTVARPHAR